jgi:glycosyltransferase involved in cell wall biosynthesis
MRALPLNGAKLPLRLVMIETKACGTPVLAFRQGSAPEIINQGVMARFKGMSAFATLRIPLLLRFAMRSAAFAERLPKPSSSSL